MRAYLLLVCGLMFCPHFISAQWQTLTRAPSGGPINSISFVNGQTGYVSFDVTSEMARTTDGGITYTSLQNHSGNLIHSIFFTSADTGYAACDNVVEKTTNAGTTWRTILISSSGELFLRIYFIDQYQGFVTSNTGNIYHTVNGGITWDSTALGAANLNAISFADQYTGFCSAWNYIFKTIDGGNHWNRLPETNIYASDIAFVNRNTGFISGSGSVIYRTVDGGQTWKESSTCLPAIRLSFPSESVGFACGSDGVSKTTDGGLSWHKQLTTPGGYQLMAIQFLDTNTGFTAGSYSNVMGTVNGGGSLKTHKLGGYVTVPSGQALDSAKVFLYSAVDTSSPGAAIDSLITDTTGYYQFITSYEQVYIKVVPDTTCRHCLTTFYWGSPGWHLASIINLCDSTDSANVTILMSTDIPEIKNSLAVTVAPDPAPGFCHITAPAHFYLLKLYDLTGRLVMTEALNENSNIDMDLPLQKLPAGTYLLVLQGNSQSVSRKIEVTFR